MKWTQRSFHIKLSKQICQAENIKLDFQKEAETFEKSNNFLLFVTPK